MDVVIRESGEVAFYVGRHLVLVVKDRDVAVLMLRHLLTKLGG